MLFGFVTLVISLKKTKKHYELIYVNNLLDLVYWHALMLSLMSGWTLFIPQKRISTIIRAKNDGKPVGTIRKSLDSTKLHLKQKLKRMLQSFLILLIL